jgi:hypothetical protein
MSYTASLSNYVNYKRLKKKENEEGKDEAKI